MIIKSRSIWSRPVVVVVSAAGLLAGSALVGAPAALAATAAVAFTDPAATEPAATNAAATTTDVGAAGLPDPKIKGKKCKSEKGVTVVVDFRDLENAKGKRLNLVKIGCARGPQDDGIDAIIDAGFDLQHSAGFVCRLDEKPLPEQTDCASEGYWSYWHGKRGGAWDYSGVGAGGWVPAAGTLEGWAWNWYDEAEADPRVTPEDLYPVVG